MLTAVIVVAAFLMGVIVGGIGGLLAEFTNYCKARL
jgi:hypothetical protein